MDPQLEELKQQRDLIARHLAWLDNRIATFTVTSSAHPTATPPSAPSREETSAPAKEPAPLSSETTQAVDPMEDPLIQHWTQASREGLAPSQKWGCIVLATILTVGLLALFWLLPMWLYD